MSYLSQCDSVSGCSHIYPSDLDNCPNCGNPQWASDDVSYTLDPFHYTYDIETYPNAFTCVTTHVASGKQWVHEISDRRDDRQSFIEFMYQLSNIGASLIGYNNNGFDYPVIHFILTRPSCTVTDIYNKAMSIINSNDKFGHLIWESDQIVKQIDLIQIWHYNKKNELLGIEPVSLKHLEIAMRMNNIEDLPFDVGTNLTSDQIDTLIHYNKHDVEATTRFYIRSLPNIKLRSSLTDKFKQSFTNSSDVKIGEKLLISELEKSGIQCYDRSTGRKQPRQTMRPEIRLADVVFDYIKFETPQFNAVLDFFKSKTITETKGVMSNVDVTDWPDDWLCPKEEWPSSFSVKTVGGRKISSSLHVRVAGINYFFGTGGLHGSVHCKIFESTELMKVVDIDVASFYPNLAIQNKMFPAHLGVEFCPAYLGIYKTRKSYPKKTPENNAYKLALNGSYGMSNNKYSPFYDPFYTMQTTINGQLLLCMIVEQMIKIPGLQMIQANTDGITYYCPTQYLDHQRNIQKWWENKTLLELEEALYTRMWVRDVNNYCAEFESGSIKRIGAYAHERQDVNPGTREVVYGKDPSALILPLAAEAVLVRGEDLESFIRNHKDPFDFAYKCKVPRSNNLVMRWSELGVDVPLPNIIRYYVSTDGGSLVKVAPPKGEPGTWKRKNGISDGEFEAVMNELSIRMSELDAMGGVPGKQGITIDGQFIEWDVNGTPHDERIHTKNKSKYDIRETSFAAGWKVSDCSNMDNFDWSNLNYDYYISEAKKLIEPLSKVICHQ